jgi:Uma2 family endonuclease
MPPTNAPVAAPKKLMTAEEFWDFCHLPENENKFLELMRGEVVELPRPNKRHGVAATRIARYLDEYAERVLKEGYVTSNDTGVILEREPDTVVGPDVAFYLDAKTFDELHPKWGEEPPVLAVEVLSPNDRMSKVNAKIADYLKNGVRVVWLLDPEEKHVTVYRPARAFEIIPEVGELAGGDDLPGFACRVADLFRLPGDITPVEQPPS